MEEKTTVLVYSTFSKLLHRFHGNIVYIKLSILPYSFDDRTMAYVWGSAFYGIYFIVSFPGFYYFDSELDGTKTKLTLWSTFTTACGHGMMILTLLDFVRLHLGIPLKIGGIGFAVTS